MSDNNAVVANPVVAPVTPAPAIQPAHTAAPVTAPVVSNPAESQAEKQEQIRISNEKFGAMRIRTRELEKELAKAKAGLSPLPAPVVENAVQPVLSNPPVPAPQAVASIEEEKEAWADFSKDKHIMGIPNALGIIWDKIDNSPKLKRRYAIDPSLAIREAKEEFLTESGIPPVAPAIPLAVKTFGGMGGGTTNDLQEMIAQCNKLQPGTREFTQLANKINVERNKRFRPTG